MIDQGITNTKFKDMLSQFCSRQLTDPSIRDWFTSKIGETGSAFFLAFGMVNKKVPRESTPLDAELIEQFKSIDPAFKPDLWTLDQLCRLAFLMHLPVGANSKLIGTLLGAADMREQVVIYKSLQYLDNAEDFVLNAVDGIRTNMIDVFDAIALNNSYPRKFFSEEAWNQMVLKAIFMERPVFKIVGLDERNNPKLSSILYDFVHERWAAHRPVTPELWRMTTNYLNDALFDDLKKVIETDTDIAKTAAIKVISESNFTPAQNWLQDQGFSPSDTTWEEIGHEVWASAKPQG